MAKLVYMCATVLQYRQAIIMHEIAACIAIIIIIVATENNNAYYDSGKKYKQHPTQYNFLGQNNYTYSYNYCVIVT